MKFLSLLDYSSLQSGTFACHGFILYKTFNTNILIRLLNMIFKTKQYYYMKVTAAAAQWFRAFALQAEGWVFESQLRQTVKTDGDSSIAKRSA